MAWSRSAALSMDLIRNSGRLKGAMDQVIVDTVGVGLTLTPQPDLSRLQYDKAETAEFCRIVKRRWNQYARNASECDMRGKLTVAQMVDIALRWYAGYGEVTGVFDFWGNNLRAEYGIQSGTKMCMTPPIRLVQDTSASEGLYQGIRHDSRGRAIAYRFLMTDGGFTRKEDHPARDAQGRPMVLHVFDPNCATEVRGISPMAPAFRKHIQAEMLDDATLQMAILQTMFAITLTSESPSQDAFEALSLLKDENGEDGKSLAGEYFDYLGAQLDRAAEGQIDVGSDPRVSHLGPGEKLGIESAKVPGQGYMPFSSSLLRDMARAIGITPSSLTLDYTQATYASVRMETASLWPVAVRRRQRIAAPVCQAIYAQWLDEEMGEGRIPLKGGYRAFLANRAQVCAASWQGPPQPTADDHKSARGSTERLQNGTSAIAIEAAQLGIDVDELMEMRRTEHEQCLDYGLPSPFERRGNGRSAQDAGKDDDDEAQGRPSS